LFLYISYKFYKLSVNRKPGRKADWFVAGLRQPWNSPSLW